MLQVREAQGREGRATHSTAALLVAVTGHRRLCEVPEAGPGPTAPGSPGHLWEVLTPRPRPILLHQKLWPPMSTPRDSDPIWGPCSIIPKHAWALEEKIHERERAGRKQIQRTEQLNKALNFWIWTEKIRMNLEPSSSPYKGPATTRSRSTQTGVSKYDLPPEGIGAPWRRADSRARAGNAQSESGTSCHTREQRN